MPAPYTLVNFYDPEGDAYAHVQVTRGDDVDQVGVDLARFLLGLKCSTAHYRRRELPTRCPDSGAKRRWTSGPGHAAALYVQRVVSTPQKVYLAHSGDPDEYDPPAVRVYNVCVSDTEITVATPGAGPPTSPVEYLSQRSVPLLRSRRNRQ